MFSLRLSFLIVGLAFLGLGCGSSGPASVKVSGSVKYDGKPIENGEVYFVPTAGGKPDIFKIVGGLYEGNATAGVKKVQVYGYGAGKAPPKDTPGADGGNFVENKVPAKHNQESTLSKEITPPGPVRIDLDLAK